MKIIGTRKIAIFALSTLLAAGSSLALPPSTADASAAEIVASVNMRTQPSTSSTTIRTLKTSETVTILSQVNDYWYKISDSSGRVGYVSTNSKYIQPQANTASVIKNVSFRKAPSTTSERIRYLQQGEDIVILDEVNDYWYKIQDSRGVIGYVTTSDTYIDSDYGPVSKPPAAPAPSTRSATIEKVVNAGIKYLGTPYEFGSDRNSTRTFDCSDFVRRIYIEGAGITLPSNSRSQGDYIKQNKHNIQTDWKKLKRGDLMFFMSYKGSSESDYRGIKKSTATITHVGMYLGNGKMIQTFSTASGGVTIVDIGSNHWEYRFLFGGSVLP